MWLFSLVLGHSRMSWGRFVLHQDLPPLLRVKPLPLRPWVRVIGPLPLTWVDSGGSSRNREVARAERTALVQRKDARSKCRRAARGPLGN